MRAGVPSGELYAQSALAQGDAGRTDQASSSGLSAFSQTDAGCGMANRKPWP
jgi:hypothetical protein